MWTGTDEAAGAPIRDAEVATDSGTGWAIICATDGACSAAHSPGGAMFCAYCGAETQTGEGRCRACGRPLPDLSASRAAPTVLTGAGVAVVSSDGVLTIDPLSSPTHLDPTLSGPLMSGQAFGTRYHIIRELGRGGMGVVYQAWDDELGVAVALKTIRADTTLDPEAAREREQRFKRELVLARQVTHKHVVRIHDLGEINGIKYLTMPFIQGETLGARIRREGHLPVARALRFARQIVSGLAAAHEEGVVHRDLKPANVMIDADDEVVILDFGLARSVSGMTLGTATGAVMGTVEYMAPEQASGSHVDQRADIYAFGLIFHEMLVGRRRSSDSALSELMLRAREAPPSVRTLDPEIPEALDRIVARCLKPDPAERHQTSAELAAELDRLDAEGCPLLGRAVSRPRKWLVPALAAACVVAIAAAVALFLWGGRGAPAPAAPHAPVSVLVADFDNRTGDRGFEGALEQTLRLAIEGASFITAYPRADAIHVLARITDKPDAKLDEAGARLVARSEGISVVLPGSIARDGSGYAIDLKVIDPAGLAPPRAVRRTARSKDQVVTAVVSLSGQVRSFLGDTASASAMQAAAETFTTVSLDAMREYAMGQNLMLARKDDEAIPHYRAAIGHDPKFGRAYSGWAVAAFTIGRQQEAIQAWDQAIQLLDRMTERERLRTRGGYYLAVTQDYDKAIENYETLVKRYPADTAGHSNLALAYFYKLNFTSAFEEVVRSLELQKTQPVRWRSNYALIAMYAGRFVEAETDSRVLINEAPSLYIVYLPLAVTQVVKGDLAGARQTYAKMAGTGQTGRSTAALGLADLALYEGQPAEARTILEKGIEEDTRAHNSLGAISGYAALAEAALMDGDKRAAIAAADKLVPLGHSGETLVPAAMTYVATGKMAEARRLASDLANQVPPQRRALGRIIEGQIALHEGRKAESVDAFKEAVKLADLWLARYGLGIAYLESGDFVTAQAELKRCEDRRGEATAIFLDDMPTTRYLAPLRYWIGRANEGLNQKAAAAEDYKKFLALRPEGSKDPLAIDARARLVR